MSKKENPTLTWLGCDKITQTLKKFCESVSDSEPYKLALAVEIMVNALGNTVKRAACGNPENYDGLSKDVLKYLKDWLDSFKIDSPDDTGDA